MMNRAAIACWWPQWLLDVELTYFWGLAGTLMAVVTPDLSAGLVVRYLVGAEAGCLHALARSSR